MTAASRLDLAVEVAERRRCQRALAAMTAALGAATHAYVGPDRTSSCDAEVQLQGVPMICCGRPDDPVHQTPDVVRARHGLGAG